MKQAITCVLIDDDIDDQEIFMLALQDIQTSVNLILTNNGPEALEKFAREEDLIPDYIFIDLNMPRMNGRQCLVEIKKIPRIAKVPVYIYSTSSEERDIQETRLLGAAGYISKPSSIPKLASELARVFNRG